jgi:hypothetical protein
MKKTMLAVIAASGMVIGIAIAPANAARYCVGENCNFSSRASCERHAARIGDDCERYRGQRGGIQGSRFDSRDQLEPSRPYGANRNQCYFDDGGGRFRPCEQPSGGRS